MLRPFLSNKEIPDGKKNGAETAGHSALHADIDGRRSDMSAPLGRVVRGVQRALITNPGEAGTGIGVPAGGFFALFFD
jgi:hypothetical protein